jgi:phosphoribosylformimino-5-aminoimidazole carboxamide ribotide isomerase
MGAADVPAYGDAHIAHSKFAILKPCLDITVSDRLAMRFMEIIPVVDIKRGQVVGARFGNREDYRPIETPLSPTSDPVDVARGLLRLYPFRTLYVADLDAIEMKGENNNALLRLRAAFPNLAFWVDNGVRDIDRARKWLAEGLGDLVLGSEVQKDMHILQALAGESRVLLSLDFRGDSFQGPPALLDRPDLWPQRIIAMTLARVGSAAGPDLESLAYARAVAPDCRIYAAGGVRYLADIEALAVSGVSGALVATALHTASLSADALARAHRLPVP